MPKITPCLWFDSNAEEAVNFYVQLFVSVFGPKGSTITGTTRYDDAGASASGQPKGSVMTVSFSLRGQEFLALNGGPIFKFSPAISFIVNCQTQKEIDVLWETLATGDATEQCGWVKDKYGLSWQIVPAALARMMANKDAARSARVMQALMQMKKIDIKTLTQAYGQK